MGGRSMEEQSICHEIYQKYLRGETITQTDKSDYYLGKALCLYANRETRGKIRNQKKIRSALMESVEIISKIMPFAA